MRNKKNKKEETNAATTNGEGQPSDGHDTGDNHEDEYEDKQTGTTDTIKNGANTNKPKTK